MSGPPTAVPPRVRQTPDWRLVLRKDLGDLVGRMGRKPLTRTLGVVALFGLVVPLRFTGVANLPAFFAVFMAFVPARLVAIDSLAGERERGTLESLLASPLSDRGIAVGKVAAATVYGAVRGWLFVAVWVPAAVVARAAGLSGAPVPSALVLVLTLVGAVVVAYGTAVFGVWQSARARSVRAISESGGTLRLAIIVSVFFVAPWLLGLLSPTGQAPQLPIPGSGEAFSFDVFRASLQESVTTVVALGAGAVLLGGAWLWRLSVATLRRCRRESLTLV